MNYPGLSPLVVCFEFSLTFTAGFNVYFLDI